MSSRLKYILGSLLVLVLGITITFYAWTFGLPSHIRHIPKNATKVFTVDPISIFDKVALDVIFDLNFYDLIIEILTKEGISTENKGPRELGFDLFQQYYFFNVDEIGNDNGYYGAVIPLGDVEMFSEYMIGRFQDQVEIDGPFKIVETTPKTALAWNDEVVLVIGGHKYANHLIKELFDLTLLESLAGQNEAFKDFQTTGFEVGAWMDFQIFYEQNYSRAGMLTHMGVTTKAFEKSYLTAATQFYDGEVDLDINLHYNELLASIMPDILKGKDNSELLKYMMFDDPSIVGRISLNNEKFNQLLKDNSSKMGMVIGSIIRKGVPDLLNGNISIAISEIGLRDVRKWDYLAEIYWKETIPDYEYIAGAEVDSFETLQKHMNSPFILNHGDHYEVRGLGKDIGDTMYIFLHDEKMFFTQSPRIRNRFIEVKDNPALQELDFDTEKAEFNIGIKELLNDYTEEAVEFFKIEHKDILQNNIDDLDIVVNGDEDDAYNANVKVNLKNKSKNSLYTLMNMYSSTIKFQKLFSE